MKTNPFGGALIMMGLTACMGAVLSGGIFAVLGGIGLIGMAVGGYAMVKRETEIEPVYQPPPARWEIPPQEDGYHYQQIVAEGRGAGRER